MPRERAEELRGEGIDVSDENDMAALIRAGRAANEPAEPESLPPLPVAPQPAGAEAGTAEPIGFPVVGRRDPSQPLLFHFTVDSQTRELLRLTPAGEIVLGHTLTREEILGMVRNGADGVGGSLAVLFAVVLGLRDDVEKRLGVTAAALERIEQIANSGARDGATFDRIARIAGVAREEAGRTG